MFAAIHGYHNPLVTQLDAVIGLPVTSALLFRSIALRQPTAHIAHPAPALTVAAPLKVIV
jgi:hypothetical protein